MPIILNTSYREATAAIPAGDPWEAKRGMPAGSVCDECIALAMDEEQNEADGDPQLAYLGAPAGMAKAVASLQNGKTGAFNANGEWQQDSWVQNLARAFLFGYARERDTRLAMQLAHRIKLTVNRTRLDPSAAKELKELHKAGNTFLGQVLSKHSTRQKTTNTASQLLKDNLNTCKVAEKLNLTPHTVAKQAGFQEAVLKNHLQSRITKAHQKRNVGTAEEGSNIYFFKNENGIEKKIPWHEILDENKEVVNQELLAYGWEEVNRSDWKEIKPFKVIRMKDSPTENRSRAELVTVKPSYSMKTFGLGTFGHTYIRFYKPIVGEDGSLTKNVEVYSIGYNLKDITLPDVFEFIPRETVKTTIEIRDSKLKKTIEMIMKLNRLHKAYQSENWEKVLELEQQDPQLKKLYRKALCSTCANFGSALFEYATGRRIKGRPLIVRVLFPERFQDFYDRIWDCLPCPLAKLAYRIRKMTRAYYPQFIQSEQIRTNQRLQTKKRFASYS